MTRVIWWLLVHVENVPGRPGTLHVFIAKKWKLFVVGEGERRVAGLRRGHRGDCRTRGRHLVRSERRPVRAEKIIFWHSF